MCQREGWSRCLSLLLRANDGSRTSSVSETSAVTMPHGSFNSSRLRVIQETDLRYIIPLFPTLPTVNCLPFLPAKGRSTAGRAPGSTIVRFHNCSRPPLPTFLETRTWCPWRVSEYLRFPLGSRRSLSGGMSRAADDRGTSCCIVTANDILHRSPSA